MKTSEDLRCWLDCEQERCYQTFSRAQFVTSLFLVNILPLVPFPKSQSAGSKRGKSHSRRLQNGGRGEKVLWN